jgi:hypothetical protein
MILELMQSTFQKSKKYYYKYAPNKHFFPRIVCHVQMTLVKDSKEEIVYNFYVKKSFFFKYQCIEYTNFKIFFFFLLINKYPKNTSKHFQYFYKSH